MIHLKEWDNNTMCDPNQWMFMCWCQWRGTKSILLQNKQNTTHVEFSFIQCPVSYVWLDHSSLHTYINWEFCSMTLILHLHGMAKQYECFFLCQLLGRGFHEKSRIKGKKLQSPDTPKMLLLEARHPKVMYNKGTMLLKSAQVIGILQHATYKYVKSKNTAGLCWLACMVHVERHLLISIDVELFGIIWLNLWANPQMLGKH